MFGRLKAAVVGAFYAGIIFGCVLGPVAALAQTKPATLIPTNAKFTTAVITSTLALGTGTPTATQPFNATFSANTNKQFLWWNNNAGSSASAEICTKADTTSICMSSQGINSSVEPQRGTLYTSVVGGTNGVPGWDIVSCYAATPTLCNTRFFTNTTDGINGERFRIAAAGLTLSNLPSNVTIGADDTTVIAGDLTRTRYQATITPATGGAGNCGTAFAAAALTADCTVATLPAGMKLVGVYADVTAGFTCSGTCSGTKVVQCGTAAGGTQILAAGLSVAATGTFGLADADLGSGMTRAAAIQGGLIGSWSATTPVSCRFTSGTGNWGSGAATFVNAGSIKFTLITELEK